MIGSYTLERIEEERQEAREWTIIAFPPGGEPFVTGHMTGTSDQAREEAIHMGHFVRGELDVK